MGTAKCRVSGFISNIREGVSKNGKAFLTISLPTGRSEKNTDGTYNNKNQVWWELTAWGEYVGVIKSMGFKKGDNIVALVTDPRPHSFYTNDGRQMLSIAATIFNHQLCRVAWYPKDARAADSYIPEDDSSLPPVEDFDFMTYQG
ncbi:MAG: hypothetical protein Q4D58_08910 [Synergistaceae bacterium]|nr:hypothetical protein [Synergistaceae bacterium]